ncbi:unnamed protein product, partial [Cladocopium goreaui]
ATRQIIGEATEVSVASLTLPDSLMRNLMRTSVSDSYALDALVMSFPVGNLKAPRFRWTDMDAIWLKLREETTLGQKSAVHLNTAGKKTRTEKEADPGERQKKLTPRCFVIKRGDVGDRIKDLVQDFRNVMMPNSAKALKESKQNRVEDFIAVASHFSVTHLIIFSATKAATYMKLARLPQGPTLTFRVDSFTLAREVRVAQKRPQGTSRDFVTPPLQVLNGLGGPKDSPEGAGGGKSLKMSERQLVAEMLRGAFPAIDVPSFNQAECRRAVLFHYDRENDAVFFRHFVVGRRQLGVERGIKKLTRFNRLPNLAGKEDIADFVMGGGGVTSESEVDESAEVERNLLETHVL